MITWVFSLNFPPLQQHRKVIFICLYQIPKSTSPSTLRCWRDLWMSSRNKYLRDLSICWKAEVLSLVKWCTEKTRNGDIRMTWKNGKQISWTVDFFYLLSSLVAIHATLNVCTERMAMKASLLKHNNKKLPSKLHLWYLKYYIHQFRLNNISSEMCNLEATTSSIILHNGPWWHNMMPILTAMYDFLSKASNSCVSWFWFANAIFEYVWNPQYVRDIWKVLVHTTSTVYVGHKPIIKLDIVHT